MGGREEREILRGGWPRGKMGVREGKECERKRTKKEKEKKKKRKRRECLYKYTWSSQNKKISLKIGFNCGHFGDIFLAKGYNSFSHFIS